ncbi:MAG: hypothetical protein KDE22_13615 [Rhodobacterales bacterium]|nr:hypothetical protein [Rhodobacterales bacterium]
MSADKTVIMLNLAAMALFLALAIMLHPYWMFGVIAVGMNFTRAILNGQCLIVQGLRQLGLRPGSLFD